MYETMTLIGEERVHNGLASMDSGKLRKLRSTQMKECFRIIDEMRHKLEFVARIKGISFVDDAASRSTMSTWYALETIEGNIIWIANQVPETAKAIADFKRLRPIVEKKVKMIVCLGETGLYNDLFGDRTDNIISACDLKDAVNKAFYSGYENIKVLFSPAAENGISYETQGEWFKREVNDL